MSVPSGVAVKGRLFMMFADMFESVDIPTVIAGAIAGAILLYFLSSSSTCIKIIKNYFRDRYKCYYGEYYTYNWAERFQDQISEKEMTISRNWRGFPKVEIRIREDVTLTYHGTMRTNGRNLYFDLIGHEHPEELKLIYNEPLEREINLIIGIFSAITLRYAPFSGKLLISKNKLTFDEAKKLLGARNLLVVDSKHHINLPQHKER